jgi:nucleoside-diphosphate-sugar epimerase
LIPRLVQRGDDVAALARSPEKAEIVRWLGAEPCSGDALDGEALRRILAEFQPEAVIDQLTALPKRLNPKTIAQDAALTNRLRIDGTANLMRAAQETGARRFITQSVAFAYDPGGRGAAGEDHPLYYDAPGGFDAVVSAIDEHERIVLQSSPVEGVALRYGYFYGPGTAYAPNGAIIQDIRKRRFPVVEEGGGVFSFIHVEDAAAATVAALERGAPGVYNVVDDRPAPVREWLPFLAALIKAPKPLRVPGWLAKWAGGEYGMYLLTRLPGVSNARAKRELGWKPRYADWREGFRAELGA